MNYKNRHTPGVSINEIDSFTKSVIGIPTAVPAFVGYTPQASYQGKSYLNVPVQINSFADFQAYFCLPDPPAPADPAKQYDPQYYFVRQPSQPKAGDYIQVNGNYYSVLPDPGTIYYLYNSIRLFYANGGGTAYIVSVGSYGPPTGNPLAPGEQIVNPNVQAFDLLNGLAALRNVQAPTMYICPEATLLSVPDNGVLMQNMLAQSSTMGTSMSIFDIIGGKDPDPQLFMNDIQTFRDNTGINGLDYGAAYYPFVGTTVMQQSDLDYTNFFGGDVKQLAAIINPAENPDPNVAAILDKIMSLPPGSPVMQENAALLKASTIYGAMFLHVITDINTLPASGGVAGVITATDNQGGPWQAPANKGIAGSGWLPINLSDSQQAGLNVDAVSGKSINVIRNFPGEGILIWGARTLDGNNQDWRYLPVRRTIIYITESCRVAMQAYVFEPNNENTWEAIRASIANFLTGIWKEGGLQGASPADAFSVSCGLGMTMTSDDILNGNLIVTMQVAVVHPAEFIVITILQQQQAG